MSEFKDYYRILEVEPTATTDEVKKSYRFLATFYHPDVNPGAKRDYASRKMTQINEAYAVLSDPARRTAYDAEYTRLRGRAGAPVDDPAQIAYEAAHELVDLIGKSGFLEGLSGKVRDYRDRAVGRLQSIVTRWPESTWAVRAQHDTMLLYDQVERDHLRAREAARRLGQMAPKSEFQDVAVLVIAGSYAEEGNTTRAIELLSALEKGAVAWELRPEAASRIAALHQLSSRSESALTEYQRFLDTYPDHPYCAAARYQIARILDTDLKRYHQAIAMYQEVMHRHPGSEPAQDCQWRIDYIRQTHLKQASAPASGGGCLLHALSVLSFVAAVLAAVLLTLR